MQAFDINYGDAVIGPKMANSTPGESISVRTDLGRRVNAWRPTPAPPVPTANPNHYFCHGFSLGTYNRFGYTVFSGQDLTAVLADEYTNLGTVIINSNPLLCRTPWPIQPADVIIWWKGFDAVHSALVVNAVRTGTRLDDATLVSSKTGTGRLKIGVTLGEVRRDYADATLIEVYRD